MIHKVTGARAKHRGQFYDLTSQTIFEMLHSAKDRCEVTGLKFDYGPKSEEAWTRRPVLAEIGHSRFQSRPVQEPAITQDRIDQKGRLGRILRQWTVQALPGMAFSFLSVSENSSP